MAKLPSKFPYRRCNWVEVVFGPNKFSRFASRKNIQWIPNSHIKLNDAIHLFGQKKFTEWNGREQNARNYDTLPDPPWEWDVPDHGKNPTYFIISEENQLIEKSENEAINWWRSVEPILIKEWKLESKCRERWADCVQLFRSDLSSGEISSYVISENGRFGNIPPEEWRSVRGSAMLCNEYANFYLPSAAESQRVNGTIVIEKNFLEEKRESAAVGEFIAKPTKLVDAKIFPYLAYMIQVSENGPVGNNNRVSKKVLEHYIEQNWPSELGESTPTKITNMATFLRRPIDERGGVHTKGRDI